MSGISARRSLLLVVALSICVSMFSLPAAAKTTITFATGYSGNGLPTLMARIDEFERLNPDIDVEVLQFANWAQIREKLLTMYAAGNAPDVVHTNAAQAPEFIDKGILLDVTKYAQELNKANYFFSDVYVRNGRVYGGYETHVQVTQIYYNEDLFAKAGLVTPNQSYAVGKWNWDTFLSAAKKLTQIGPDGKVAQFAARVPVSWAPAGWGSLRLGAGGRLFSADSQRVTLDSQENRDALSFYTSLLEHHVIPRPGEGLGTGDPLTTGKIAMDLIGSARMQFYTENGANLAWDIAPPPVGPKSNATYRVPGADGLVVSTTKYPEESWRLVKFFLSDYVQNDKARTRLEVPVLKRALTAPSYLAAPPKNMRMVGDNLNRSIAQPIFMGSAEATAAIDRALLPVFRGEMSLEAGIAEGQRLAQEAMDAVLRK